MLNNRMRAGQQGLKALEGYNTNRFSKIYFVHFYTQRCVCPSLEVKSVR